MLQRIQWKQQTSVNLTHKYTMNGLILYFFGLLQFCELVLRFPWTPNTWCNSSLACVVLRARRDFPDAQGSYIGFRPPLDYKAKPCWWRNPLHSVVVVWGCSRLPPHMAQGAQRLHQRWGLAGHPHNLCNMTVFLCIAVMEYFNNVT